MALLELDRINTPELPAPWQLSRGTDWRKRLLIHEPNTTVSAISPLWVYEARLYQDYEPVSNIAIACNYINDGIELNISKVDTAELSARTYDIEISATDLANITGKLLFGKVTAQGRKA